jgi:hypothetical protein
MPGGSRYYKKQFLNKEAVCWDWATPYIGGSHSECNMSPLKQRKHKNKA